MILRKRQWTLNPNGSWKEWTTVRGNEDLPSLPIVGTSIALIVAVNLTNDRLIAIRWAPLSSSEHAVGVL